MNFFPQPIPSGLGNWPWCPPEENGLADRRYRYTLASLSHPRRCIGFARRRLGRGGRVILDRATHSMDDLWRHLDFTVIEASSPPAQVTPPKSPKSIMEQFISKTNDAKYKTSTLNAFKLTETNDINNMNSQRPRNNSNGVGLTNGPCSDLFNSDSCVNVKCEVKSEIIDRTEVNRDRFEQDELLEMLRDIKRDW